MQSGPGSSALYDRIKISTQFFFFFRPTNETKETSERDVLESFVRNMVEDWRYQAQVSIFLLNI
jgi:hypothetical protein